MTNTDDWYQDIPSTLNPNIPRDVRQYVADAISDFFPTNSDLSTGLQNTEDSANGYTDEQIASLISFFLAGIDIRNTEAVQIIKWDDTIATTGMMVQPYDVGSATPTDTSASEGDWYIQSLGGGTNLGKVQLWYFEDGTWNQNGAGTSDSTTSINPLFLFSLKKDHSGWYYDPNGDFNQSDFTVDISNYYTKAEIDAMLEAQTYISTVAHDDTLTGDGTASNPLSVVNSEEPVLSGASEIYYNMVYSAGADYYFLDYDLETNQTVIKFYKTVNQGQLTTHPDNDENLVLNRVFNQEKLFLSKHPVIANSDEINPYTGTNYTSDDCEVLVSLTDDVNAVITTLLNIDYFNSELAPITFSKGTFSILSSKSLTENVKLMGAGKPQINEVAGYSNKATYSSEGTILKVNAALGNANGYNTTNATGNQTIIMTDLLFDIDRNINWTFLQLYSTSTNLTFRTKNLALINTSNVAFNINTNRNDQTIDLNNNDLEIHNVNGIGGLNNLISTTVKNFKIKASNMNYGLSVSAGCQKSNFDFQIELKNYSSRGLEVFGYKHENELSNNFVKVSGSATQVISELSGNVGTVGIGAYTSSSGSNYLKDNTFDLSDFIINIIGDISSKTITSNGLVFMTYEYSSSYASYIVRNVLIAPKVNLHGATIGTKPIFYSALIPNSNKCLNWISTTDQSGTSATLTKGNVVFYNEFTQ